MEEIFLVWDKFRWAKEPCEEAEQVGLLKAKPIMLPGLALVKARKRETSR